MTSRQLDVIERFRQQYVNNCETYELDDSKNLCSFSVYESENPNNHTVFLVMTIIVGTDNNLAGAFVNTLKYIIKRDGTHYEVSSPDNIAEWNNYIKTLKKIE